MLRVCNKEKQLQKNMVEHNKWLHRDSGQKAALTREQHVGWIEREDSKRIIE